MNHFDSWKFNTFVNSCVRLVLMNSQSQFLTSHAIFNHRAYVKRVDWIVFCKFSSFSIGDVASQCIFPMPQALRPNTCNNYCQINLTKISFGNGGHCSATITSLSHSCWALAQAPLTTFWSFWLCTAMAFPKMRTFILTRSWCQRLVLKVAGFLGLTFFATKPRTSFKCLVNNHLA